MNMTRDRIERAATENQFMNGKIQAIEARLPPSYFEDSQLIQLLSASLTAVFSMRL